MAFQEEVDPFTRAETVNYMIDAHDIMHLVPDTLFQAVLLMDRYLQACTTDKKKMELLSVTVLYMAAIRVQPNGSTWKRWFFDMAGCFRGKTEREVLDMEEEVLRVVDWGQLPRVPTHFLSQECDYFQVSKEEKLTAMYILEVCLVDYTMAWEKPWMQAAAALCFAFKLSGRSRKSWRQYMPYYNSGSEGSLRPLVIRMAALALDAIKIPDLAPNKKYGQVRYGCIACFSDSKTRKLRKMAAEIC